MDATLQPDRRSERVLDRRAHLTGPLAQLDRRAHGTEIVILVGDRHAEQRHDLVPDRLIDDASMPLHDFRGRPPKVTEQLSRARQARAARRARCSRTPCDTTTAAHRRSAPAAIAVASSARGVRRDVQDPAERTADLDGLGERGEIRRHRRHRRVAIVLKLRQRFAHDVVDGGRKIGAPGGDRLGIAGKDRVDERLTAVPVKWPGAGQHLVEHDAQTTRRRPGGRHGGRAPARGSCRQPCRAPRLRPVIATSSTLATPKSRTFAVPSERSMTFDGFTSRWTMPCSCACCSPPAIWRATATASSHGSATAHEARLQRLAVVERHRDEQLPLGCLADLVDRADVGMIQRRRGAGLLQKAAFRLGSRAEVARQELQGDVPAEPLVERLVDHSHRPRAEGFEHAVPADGLSLPPEHR